MAPGDTPLVRRRRGRCGVGLGLRRAAAWPGAGGVASCPGGVATWPGGTPDCPVGTGARPGGAGVSPGGGFAGPGGGRPGCPTYRRGARDPRGRSPDPEGARSTRGCRLTRRGARLTRGGARLTRRGARLTWRHARLARRRLGMAGGRPGAAPDVAVVRALDGAVALSAGDGGHARLARRRVRALRGSIRRGAADGLSLCRSAPAPRSPRPGRSTTPVTCAAPAPIVAATSTAVADLRHRPPEHQARAAGRPPPPPAAPPPPASPFVSPSATGRARAGASWARSSRRSTIPARKFAQRSQSRR